MKAYLFFISNRFNRFTIFSNCFYSVLNSVCLLIANKWMMMIYIYHYSLCYINILYSILDTNRPTVFFADL